MNKEKIEDWKKKFVEIADIQKLSADQRNILYSFICQLLKSEKETLVRNMIPKELIEDYTDFQHGWNACCEEIKLLKTRQLKQND